MDFESEIERLRLRVAPLRRFVHLLAQSVGAPSFAMAETAFRFQKPELLHFCLLRAARIVSALNASIELARYGYSQEIGVLLRTAIEYDSQIDFMVASLDADGKLSEDAQAFLTGFFADDKRPAPSQTKKAKLVQKKIHDIIGARLDAAPNPPKGKTKSASDMLSNIYLIYSNYVHGRYPEIMDLYGGRPIHLHLNGMSRTPKDLENLQILDSIITSASYCFVGFAQALRLSQIINADAGVRNWYSHVVNPSKTETRSGP